MRKIGNNRSPRYPLSSFLAPWDQPIDIHQATNGTVDATRMYCIVLSGVPDSGKTELAEAQGAHPLTIDAGCYEELKNVVLSGPHKTTHIVFDEMDMRALSTEMCLTLLFCWRPRSLRVRNM